ncbi:MAG: glycosyltransferase family 4 protein [Anaerolineae bacterium]|nr:glycosyltransferase family 4 protein [Anaerolineae bacterium]
MKILIVYYEPQPSGQTAHVLSLARGLEREKYQLTVVLPDHLHGPITALREAGARVVPLALKKTLWPARSVAAWMRLVRASNPDVVHVHSQEAGLLARLLARAAGARRVFYTPQTVDIRRVRWARLYTLVERALSGVTDTIISVCEADRARMIGWGIAPAKVAVVPNGIDLARFDEALDPAALRRTLELHPTHQLVLQVGRLSAQKDPMAFVEGAALVAGRCPQAQFVLVGTGPLQGEVSARIQKLGLEQRVRLAGWHNHADRLMAVADVVTLTSRWEGMPYVLLEAMARSRPVVATAVNGSPEIVLDGVTGFVTPPGEPAAWAQRVSELLENRDGAATMGHRGRARVEEQFTLSRMIDKIEALYDRSL